MTRLMRAPLPRAVRDVLSGDVFDDVDAPSPDEARPMELRALDESPSSQGTSRALTPSDHLHRVGLRATGPRLSVLEFFSGRDARHANADEVFRSLRERGSDIALGTVYRVLSHLTDVGLLARCVFDEGVAVYELCPADVHDHLVCLECGRIEEFVDEVLDERRRAIADAHGFAAAHRQLAFYGHCPACRLARNEKAKRRPRSNER